jgi:hemolysin activation/secretion protein
VRTLTEQLTIGTGLEILEQRTRIHQGQARIPFTRDRLRVAFARLDGRVSTAFGGGGAAALGGYLEVRKGLSIFNASETGLSRDGFSPSRFEGNPQAWVVRSELIGDVRPHPNITIAAQAFGQWANDPLLNLEEFSLGNFTYGRGYDPGSNGGDRALAFRLEPRVRLPLPGRFGVEVIGFYDHVKIKNLDTGSTERSRLIRSVGGGLRLLQTQRFALDLLYAHPLDRVISTDKTKPKDRFLASLTVQLQPWGGR